MQIDFSCKHDIMIRNDDGTLTPMDVPYYKNWKIGDGVWEILSSGDRTYLLDCGEKGFAIDSGYGAGNIREYCEQLIGKPVPDIANTHDHFDHTANNAYFDHVYLTAKTKELATIPFPSFAGIDFPRNYDTVIVKGGDVIDLGERYLRVFDLPDHAIGSIVLLDEKSRILFSGDEITSHGCGLHYGVKSRAEYLRIIAGYRDRFDKMYAGSGFVDPIYFDLQLAAVEYILAGHEGTLVTERPHHPKQEEEYDQDGHIIYGREAPHNGDNDHAHSDDDSIYKRQLIYKGYRIGYDVRFLNT